MNIWTILSLVANVAIYFIGHWRGSVVTAQKWQNAYNDWAIGSPGRPR